jgi:hypothetical protein
MVERIQHSFSDGFPQHANKIMVLDKTMSLAIVEQESL